jgi:hypothetical protein
MLKKYSSVLAIVSMGIITLLLMIPLEAKATGNISISPISGQAGSKIDVTVQLEDTFMTVDVFFDTNNNGTWDDGEPGDSVTQWFTKTRKTSLYVPDAIDPGTYNIIAQTSDDRAAFGLNYTYIAKYTVVK